MLSGDGVVNHVCCQVHSYKHGIYRMTGPKYLKVISNSMEQSPSLEANSSSASQKIS